MLNRAAAEGTAGGIAEFEEPVGRTGSWPSRGSPQRRFRGRRPVRPNGGSTGGYRPSRSGRGGTPKLIIEAALVLSGRPVLVVPYIQKSGMSLEGVLVC